MFSSQPATVLHTTTRPRAPLIAFFLLLAVSVTATAYLALGVWELRAYPFDTDEANHTLPALRMAHELTDGDGSGFVAEVLGQNFYPPAGSALLVPLFLMNGASVTAARLASTASLLVAVLVLFALALEIDPETGWLAGLIAGLLTLMVRPLLIYAGLSMLETPGLLVSLLFLWAYVRAGHRPTPGLFILTSLLLAAIFLTKYSYGVVALGTVILAELPELVRAARTGQVAREMRRRWLPLFGPFALLLLGWFLRPGQAATFLSYTRPLSTAEPWLSLRNIVYYPRSLALHGLPSPWFAPVTVVGLLWAVRQWRDSGVRAVLLFFVLGMASVMLLNHPPNPRFIAPFVPAAHLLTGLMVATLWRGWQAGSGRSRQLATGLLLAVAALALVGVPDVIPRYRYAHSLLAARLETSPVLAETADWVAATTGPDAALYLVNYFDQFSAPVVEWAVAAQSGVNPPPVRGTLLAEATPEAVAALRQTILDSDVSHLILIEGSPWGSPFWPDYTAAFGDTLREVDRRSFTLVNYRVDDWLDDNQLGAAWEQTKADSRQTLELGVIVYAVERP
jgi:4-amino-4-deoxy-L-arabinose transferase-like glycosyltransferase